MKIKLLITVGLLSYCLIFMGAYTVYDKTGASNFDRLVLGEVNFGTDPNATSDITMQNDESITNSTDGTVSIVSPTLQTSRTVSDTNVFVTTATEDTVTIAGATVGDNYCVTGRWTAGVDQQDVLQWEALSGKLVVHRIAAGESALKYSWVRFR